MKFNTRNGPDSTETIETTDPDTRHRLILIREAIWGLKDSESREIELRVETQAWTISIKVKR